MNAYVPRAVFGLQGVFLLFTSSILLFSPQEVSKPGAQFEGSSHDVIGIMGLSSMSLGTCFLLIATRGSRKLLKETLLISVPLRLFAVLVQLKFGGKWVGVAKFEGIVGLINGVCALLL